MFVYRSVSRILYYFLVWGICCSYWIQTFSTHSKARKPLNLSFHDPKNGVMFWKEAFFDAEVQFVAAVFSTPRWTKNKENWKKFILISFQMIMGNMKKTFEKIRTTNILSRAHVFFILGFPSFGPVFLIWSCQLSTKFCCFVWCVVIRNTFVVSSFLIFFAARTYIALNTYMYRSEHVHPKTESKNCYPKNPISPSKMASFWGPKTQYISFFSRAPKERLNS